MALHSLSRSMWMQRILCEAGTEVSYTRIIYVNFMSHTRMGVHCTDIFRFSVSFPHNECGVSHYSLLHLLPSPPLIFVLQRAKEYYHVISAYRQVCWD
jgi:hypothetical protein